MSNIASVLVISTQRRAETMKMDPGTGHKWPQAKEAGNYQIQQRYDPEPLPEPPEDVQPC